MLEVGTGAGVGEGVECMGGVAVGITVGSDWNGLTGWLPGGEGVRDSGLLVDVAPKTSGVSAGVVTAIGVLVASKAIVGLTSRRSNGAQPIRPQNESAKSQVKGYPFASFIVLEWIQAQAYSQDSIGVTQLRHCWAYGALIDRVALPPATI